MGTKPAAIFKLLAPGFAKYSTAECLERLDREDVLCAPVLTLGDALAQPQVAANGLMTRFEHPVHGTVDTVGNPLKMSSVSQIATRGAPTLGQHNDEVLSELGYSAADISRLRGEGVIA